MRLKLDRRDHELLACIAEHRALVTAQIAALRGGNPRSVRNRINKLTGAGLLSLKARRPGCGAGRLMDVISLAAAGVDALRSTGRLQAGVADEQVTIDRFRCLELQLLVNWSRIHLQAIAHIVPGMTVRCLCPTSPILGVDADGNSIVHETLTAAGSDKPVSFIPDAVFCIECEESKKALLFFLEADMGTEAIVSRSGRRGDVRQKILAYQEYFRSGRYKRYEEVWSDTFPGRGFRGFRGRGFRVLFVTNTMQRLAVLCRLVREMPPADFVWLTEENELLSRGASAAIWARGGALEAPRQSILGTRTPNPVPTP